MYFFASLNRDFFEAGDSLCSDRVRLLSSWSWRQKRISRVGTKWPRKRIQAALGLHVPARSAALHLPRPRRTERRELRSRSSKCEEEDKGLLNWQASCQALLPLCPRERQKEMLKVTKSRRSMNHRGNQHGCLLNLPLQNRDLKRTPQRKGRSCPKGRRGKRMATKMEAAPQKDKVPPRPIRRRQQALGVPSED